MSDAKSFEISDLEWQPMDSAPKDGTSILLACGKEGKFVRVGCWVPHLNSDDDACWTTYRVKSWMLEEYLSETPLGWMTLPVFKAVEGSNVVT